MIFELICSSKCCFLFLTIFELVCSSKFWYFIRFLSWFWWLEIVIYIYDETLYVFVFWWRHEILIIRSFRPYFTQLMTVGPRRLSANCWGDVGVKWNLIFEFEIKNEFILFYFILFYFWSWELKWFLDRMWDSDCVGIMRMITWIWIVVVLIIAVWTTVVWYDERPFVIPFIEQTAGELLRMLTYSVSRYWCNGIRGFHMEQWGCFWWVFVSCIIRRHCSCFTVHLHLLFSTPSRRRHICAYCYTSPWAPAHEPIPA